MSVNRTSILGGFALVAVFALGATASAQDQPAQNPPVQTQSPQAPPPQERRRPQHRHLKQRRPKCNPRFLPRRRRRNCAVRSNARRGIQLPQLNVTAPLIKRPPPRAVARRTEPPPSPADQVTQQQNSFDTARSNIFTTIGTTSSTVSHAAIQALPQGTNAPVEKVLLQAPGVSQDSASSGSVHVRNDHANLQFRINGIMLPDGVTGFGSFLDTGLIGSLSLITGALPAEYGLRTTGLIDITTRNDIFNNSGSVSYYGGSRGTIEPSFEYGGTFGANCASGPAASATPKPPPPPRLVSAGCNISSAAAICRPPRASKIRCRRSTPSMISRSRSEASPICRASSTPIRG